MSKMKVVMIAALLSIAGLCLNQKKAVADQGSGSINLTDGSMNVQKLWVYNQDAVSHSAGSVMVYVKYTAATYPGLSVSTSVTSNDGLVAGIVVDKTIQANSWGYIQIRGYTSTLKITGAVLAGDALIQSGTAEKAAQYTVLLATGNAAQTSNVASPFARSLDNAASSTTIRAILFGL